jgi:hypothetical protein
MREELPTTLTDDECRVILDSHVSHSLGENEDMSRRLVDSLTVEEQEVAARSSYAYWIAGTRSEKPLPTQVRERAAMREACRHLNGSGNFEFALKCLKNTVAFRTLRNIEVYRTCMDEGFVYANQEHTKLAAKLRYNINENMKFQTMVPRGHDRNHNAVLLSMPRKSKGERGGAESFLDFIIYSIERTVACTEAISKGKSEKIVVVLDCKKSCAPCLKAMKKAIHILQNHFPNRLKNLVIIDPPAWLSGAYHLLKPFLDPDTRTKFIMAKGEKQKAASFGGLLIDESQATPNMLVKGELTSPIDSFFFLTRVPFYCLYDSPPRPSSSNAPPPAASQEDSTCCCTPENKSTPVQIPVAL